MIINVGYLSDSDQHHSEHGDSHSDGDDDDS